MADNKSHTDDDDVPGSPGGAARGALGGKGGRGAEGRREASEEDEGGQVVGASFDEEPSDAGALPHPAANLAVADEEEDEEEDELPAQIGYRKYVYAAFFCFAIAAAYFMSKASLAAWHRLSQWTSRVGEPREDWTTPVAAVVAGIITFLVYRRPDVRQLADEVALELSKVEWPTREKVRRSTTIVVVATLGSAFLFWIYDLGANRSVGLVVGSDHPLIAGFAAGAIIYGLRELGSRYLMGKS